MDRKVGDPRDLYERLVMLVNFKLGSRFEVVVYAQSAGTGVIQDFGATHPPSLPTHTLPPNVNIPMSSHEDSVFT